jgi:peroxiredoxin
MIHILKTILIAILIILPLTGCGNADESRQPARTGTVENGIMTGQRAPDFMLNDLSGKAFRLSELRDKKPVLLIFWATWCPACLQAMPYFAEMHKQYTPRGLEIISINIATNDPLIRVQRFQEARKLPYPILYDQRNDVSRLYAVFGIPTSILIDRDGIIQYRGNVLPENINRLLDKLLAPSS